MQKELRAVSGNDPIDDFVTVVKEADYKLSPVIADKKGRLPEVAADFNKKNIFYPRDLDTEVKLLENMGN